MSTLNTLFERYGQSPWLEVTGSDHPGDEGWSRALAQGVRGATVRHGSLARALSTSERYDGLFADAKARNASQLAEALMVQDARTLCDELESLYHQSRVAFRERSLRYCDGLVTLEVAPTFGHDRAALVAAAARVAGAVQRPNVVVSIAATPEGLAAVSEVLGAGISVNVTLVNSLSRYEQAFDAWLAGVELAIENGVDVGAVACTISVAMAPIDAVYDSLMHRHDKRRGTSAVSTVAGIYRRFRKRIVGRRETSLLGRGVQVPRPLWTSMTPTDRTFFDLLYVNHVAAFETVATFSRSTMDLVLDHGDFAGSLLATPRRIKTTSFLVKDLPRSFSHPAIANKLDGDELAGAQRDYEALTDAVLKKMPRHP
ncbi:MAG: transaldolase family protein [Acidimicrobiales bacterium]